MALETLCGRVQRISVPIQVELERVSHARNPALAVLPLMLSTSVCHMFTGFYCTVSVTDPTVAVTTPDVPVTVIV
jgi:hypothetical protein